jgi:hypothetical protein
MRTLLPAALALVSAAIRHIRDAEHLVGDPAHASASPDQAWHLAGFAPECVRKATLERRSWDKVLGHRFDTDAETTISIAQAVDPAAVRYELADWTARFPILAEWDPACRYDRTGTWASRAPALVAEARAALGDVLAALWADGRIPAAALDR